MWVIPCFLPRHNTEGPPNEYKSFSKNAEADREVTKLQFLS